MRLLPDLPAARDRDMLAGVLATFGAILLREVGDSAVLAVFRLAIAEATRSPQSTNRSRTRAGILLWGGASSGARRRRRTIRQSDERNRR
jgi:hypothetical protein